MLNEWINTVQCMDALDYLRKLPNDSVHCCVTSPPYYGLRDYSANGQIGLEDTPAAYVAQLVKVFEEVRRVLRPDGTCWVNLGDTYAGGGRGSSDAHRQKIGVNTAAAQSLGRMEVPNGLKPKDLIGIPWRVAFALQDAGWWLRSDIIWHKPNPMPESVTDRPTKAHEYVFLLAKSGTTQFWIHRDKPGQRTKPTPDYRWVHLDTGKETALDPGTKARWRRVNLWRGHDYWYDADAIRENAINGKNRATWGGGTERIAKANICGGGHVPSDKGMKSIITTSRNKRTVWTIPTEPSSLKHFAMFPQALIEPMILAGCPATVCSACGAGYVRVTEKISVREQAEQIRTVKTSPSYKTLGANDSHSSGVSVAGNMSKSPLIKTLGFSPSCDCNATTSAGITLDPFMGTGTTALVAQKHGRHWGGCDVNAETVELANNRTRYHGEDKRMIKEQSTGVYQIGLFDKETK